MEEKYCKPVYPVNCLELSEEDIKGILQKILFEFPLKEAAIELPRWIISLDKDHWLKRAVFEAIKDAASGIRKISEVSSIGEKMCGCEHITKASVDRIDLGKGRLASPSPSSLSSSIRFSVRRPASRLTAKRASCHV